MPHRIAIVGGGVIGTSTAYQLSRLAKERNLTDLDITLVEGSEIAAGASGKAGGLLALDWHGPSTASLAALSYSLHASLAAEHSGASRWGYRQLSTISVSADFSSLSRGSTKPRGARKLKGADEEHFDWLSKEVLTGSELLGTPETTAQVHPEQFSRAMAQLAEERGVKIVYGTVNGLEKPSSPNEPYRLSIRARSSSDSSTPSTLEVDQVVIAAGPWTGRLLSSLGLSSGRGAGRAKAIRGSRAHSVVLRPAEGRELPATAVFTSIKTKGGHAEPEIYNRPDGTSYACGPTDDSDLPTHASDVVVEKSAIASLLAHTAQLSPTHLDAQGEGGNKAKVEREQACYLPVGSGDPVIGQIEGEKTSRKGVYVASGHSCWGICNGPGTGLVMAELLLDGKVESADVSDLGP
ncbi:hypothetical protein JCM11251_003522 [Rhodosporidiobolus azoricus]